MINRNTEQPYKLTFEDIILTAWCVYEDLYPSNCQLVLNPKQISSYVYCSSASRNRLITSLVNVFCKLGTGLHGQMMVSIDECNSESVKISVSSKRHVYSFREPLSLDLSTP